MYHSSGDYVFGVKWDPPPLTPRALHRLLLRKSHVPEVLQGTLLKLGPLFPPPAQFFVLYWYKSTNTDAECAASFACFTGTKVQTLTLNGCA